jgi:hypothetical protein
MTEFSYTVKRSKIVGMFYIMEIEKDEFGKTERPITRALTKKEMRELSKSILTTIEDFENRKEHTTCPWCGHALNAVAVSNWGSLTYCPKCNRLVEL